MTQVRVCRSKRVLTAKNECIAQGAWEPMTLSRTQDLELIVEAGNKTFGEGSHWLEERDLANVNDDPDLSIWRFIRRSMQAWLIGDFVTHTSYFTPSAVFIAPDGTCFRGKYEIKQAFQGEAERLPSRTMEIQSFQISYLTADVAIVMMHGEMKHSNSQISQRWASTQTLSRDDDGWLIAAHQVFHRV